MATVQKKKKLKLKNLFILMGCGFLLGLGIYFVSNLSGGLKTGYLKGVEPIIKAYDKEGNLKDGLPRGSQIKYDSREKMEKDGNNYVLATMKSQEFYIDESCISSKEENLIEEKEMYVRTAYHLLSNDLDGTLLDLVEKGSKIEINGYHQLQADGTVDYYKTKIGPVEGYFPGKYLVNDESLAKANYDEENSYQIHAKRGNVYGGGSAANADYFPVEKPIFSNNKMPDEVKAFYLNGTSQVLANVEQYIALAKDTNINAFVVDIKDSGVPAYQSDVMKAYSPTNYQHAQQSAAQYKTGIQKLKDAGFYVIGRISVFKDKYYATDHPENTILDTRTNKPYLLAESYWPSAYSREVWKYNVDLAKEAVTLMGFNEIQFDYVRFPDRVSTLEKQGLLNYGNTHNEEKLQAVQRFLMYATNELHKQNVYVSADVFGESAHTYVTAYGQYWPAISNVVDVISGMPYPDHFSTYEYGFKAPVWTTPYEILNYWGKNYVMKRQSEIKTPAITRTWIQTYDSIKSPKVVYGPTEVAAQIKGLYDAGLTGGYMTWNSGSNITKYRSQAEAYNKEYK